MTPFVTNLYGTFADNPWPVGISLRDSATYGSVNGIVKLPLTDQCCWRSNL